MFQLWMDAIIEQCPGVIGIHDDMVIFGVDQEDHDANLINLLNVCQKEGLVLNSKKLELRRERVTFFGAEYSTQGMHPDPKKVQGITEMIVPTDKQQLQSFLGMVNYMGTFIPNLSHHTDPLWAMLKKDNIFHWEEQQTRSFQQVKTLIVKVCMCRSTSCSSSGHFSHVSYRSTTERTSQLPLPARASRTRRPGTLT